MGYGELIYRRGYVVVHDDVHDELVDRITDWPSETAGPYHVYVHPDLSIETQKSGDQTVSLLGTVVDPIESLESTSKIVSMLLEAATEDDTAFLDRLSDLSGRFVILVRSDENLTVLPDAVGTKTIFYDRFRPVAASHPGIIAESFNYRKSVLYDELRESGETYYPALATPFNEVRRLSPNTLLRLPNLNVERFFPRDEVDSLSLSEATARVSSILSEQTRLLAESEDLIQSLSAGLDSRVTLASTRNVSDQMQYYSWGSEGRPEEELHAVLNLCERVGISDRHTITTLNNEPPAAWREMFEAHLSGMVSPGRIEGTYNHYEKFPEGAVEYRANGAEIGQAFYRGHVAPLPKRPTPETGVKLYFRANSNHVLREFEEFFTTTSFPTSKVYGYDPYDLLYWEFRMGSWLSQWLAEKDVSHENIISFNNREIIKAMLGVKMKHRKSNTLFNALIRDMWPEALSIPVNPHKQREKQVKKVKRFAFGAAFKLPLPIFRTGINAYRKY